MRPRLYLDTARLGLMSHRAQWAQRHFATLVGEEAGTLYLENLLRDGSTSLPGSYQRQFPGLLSWQGVASLKFQLGRLVELRDEQRILLAQRSAALMKLAAQLQLARCRHILTTDLSWPTYQEVLQKEARRQSVGVTRVPLLRSILNHRVPSETVIDRVCRTFAENRCDGLFLPLVSNLGIRLPVEEIVTRLRQESSLRFVVVDGAQALGHVPIDLSSGLYDLFLAGCHKWLSAYNSLGLMFHGQSRYADEIDVEIQERLRTRRFDDPLASLTEELIRGTLTRFGETVNLLPLFTCGGALADVAAEHKPLVDTLAGRIANRSSLLHLCESVGWTLVETADDFQTGIALLRPKATHLQCLSPHILRERFHRTGISVTAYARGLVRISLPGRSWTSRELEHLAGALERVHEHVRLRIEEISSRTTEVA